MRKRFLRNDYGQNSEFWDKVWELGLNKYSVANQLVNSVVATQIKKYLRTDSVMLEGGCGDGRYVKYFSDLKQKVIGIDYAKNTVSQINNIWPDLDVRYGDIRNIQFPDNYFDLYYSGGVIEHFEDGIKPQLIEARRVLKNKGYLIVTVPFMNFVRKIVGAVKPVRWKIDLNDRYGFHIDNIKTFVKQLPINNYHFHEYVFHSFEMKRHLKESFFEIIDEICFSAEYGLRDIELYNILIGRQKIYGNITNKVFRVPLKILRMLENTNSHILHKINSIIFGNILGNLKMYVCTACK